MSQSIKKLEDVFGKRIVIGTTIAIVLVIGFGLYAANAYADQRLGKATFDYFGAWQQSIIEDGILYYYVDESVSDVLGGNVRQAFDSWSNKLDKISDDTLRFYPTSDRDEANIIVEYEDGESEKGFTAETHIYYNDYDGSIKNAIMTLYKNEDFYKDGYKYDVSYKQINKGAKIDAAFYKGFYNTIQHEIGHTLGLKHIEDNPNYLMATTGQFYMHYPISMCEAAAVIEKNFNQRDLQSVKCNGSVEEEAELEFH